MPNDHKPAPEKDRTCRCGHRKSEHRRAWGPNSIGQHGFGLCINGWKVTHGYVFDHGGACKCERFRRRWWGRRVAIPPEGRS